MNKNEAEKLARSFLCESIELIRTEPSDNLTLYNFHKHEEVLFRFQLFGGFSIGSPEYISISKTTGKVRYLGSLGE